MAKGVIYQLAVMPLSEEQKEIVSAFLQVQDVEAIEETDAGLQLYHDSKERVAELAKYLCDSVAFLWKDQMSISPLPNQNWNHAWESSFSPITIGSFCTIRATFHDLDVDTDHEIVIDPEMAFGTGHHETTYSMIAAMKSLSFKNKRVLDYGCGTAILAILAEKLGAASVDAIDYDPLATECAEKCLDLNNCNRITLKTGELTSIRAQEKYDIILANINRNVLLENVNDVAIRMKEGGILLLSGILKDDQDKVVDSYEYHGFRTEDVTKKGEWLCIKMIRV